MMKRMLSALLAAWMAISALISCASDDPAETPDTTNVPVSDTAETAAPETEPDYLEILPAETLDGLTFRFIAHHGTGGRLNFPNQDGISGEVVNDALYERNELLAQKYDVNFENIAVESVTALSSLVTVAARADDDAYDVIFLDMATTAKAMVLDKTLIPYSQIPHVDLTKEWWSQHNEDLTIMGEHYFPTGVITPQYFNALYLMLFNQQLAENYQVGDLYQMVRDGKWTLDTLNTLMNGAVNDLNGDGKMGLNDGWPMVYDEVAGFAFYFGAGGEMTLFDEEKIPYLALNTEHAINLVELLRPVVGDKNRCLRGEDYTKGAEIPVFAEGRSLFTACTLFFVRTNYREMENDFGVLPMPKLNEEQKDYYSYAQPWSGTGVSLPVTNSKVEKTGLILEAMAYLSNTYVRESMYESALKEKFARDPFTGEMLDIISAGVRFDLNVIFNWGGTASILRDSVLGNNQNYVSSIQSKEAVAAATIKKYFASLKKAD